MSDQYYPFYVGDYLRDTGDLTLVEHGAYHLLLHHYYTSGGKLTCDRSKLYRICRAFSQDEQTAIDLIVVRYFSENGDGHLKNKKADEVICKREAFLAQQSAKGKKSAEKRWGKVTNVITTVEPMLQPNCNLPSPSPYINIKTSSSSNDDGMILFDAFWKNYPKKIGKAAAKRAWKKIKNKAEVIEKMKMVLPKQKQSEQWTKENGQYIPHPATYLNQGRWDDEIID